MNSTAPLAEEYANSTETRLDKSKPQSPVQQGKAQGHAGSASKPAAGKNPAREEHPISVGKS